MGATAAAAAAVVSVVLPVVPGWLPCAPLVVARAASVRITLLAMSRHSSPVSSHMAGAGRGAKEEGKESKRKEGKNALE